MRSHPAVPVLALVGFLICASAPGVAQVPPGPPVPAPPPGDLVQFTPPNEALQRENLQVGQEYTGFDLCRGGPATTAGPGALNPSDSPCGDPLNPSTTVTGGNPPYHFQLDTMGGFPPLGMWVDLNGVLRGKPSGTRGATFQVCAVDQSGRGNCKPVTVPDPKPAAPLNAQVETASPAKGQPANTKGGGSGLPLLMAGLGAAGVGAYMYGYCQAHPEACGGQVSSEGTGSVSGRCNADSPRNACGSCTCVPGNCSSSSQCGGGGCWTSGSVPPFCN